MKPALLLLPNLLGDQRHHEPFLPASVDKAVESLDGLICESASSGRRFLGRFKTAKPAHEIPIALLNEHTSADDLLFLLEPIQKQKERWGLIADAGLPCIADPGYLLVQKAKSLGITIQAFVGPSSFSLALMLSGLPAQSFAFNGYLPKKEEDRCKQIAHLERRSKNEKSTQIFIETPYRNSHALESLLTTLSAETLLTLAWDLTLPEQGVITQTVAQWKKSPLPNLEKRCVTFLFHA